MLSLMPLQDSFKKRTRTNLVKLSTMPTMEDLHFGMSQSMDVNGEPSQFAWIVGRDVRVLTIVKSASGEATWILKAGESVDAIEIWRYATTDVQTIYTLIAQEATPAQAAVIPEHLRPQAEVPKPQAELPKPQAAPETEQKAAATDSQGDFQPGVVFADRYEIVEIIGKGASGTVYKAKQRFIDRFVALKVLHPHLVKDSISKKRFEHEAKAASALHHPNLIVIYDFGFSDSGSPFIAMEYVEGFSLDHVLQQKKLLNRAAFRKIFSQCCLALTHAHQRSVIHRDLKPSNIVLSRGENGEPFVKVVDFGLAKMLRDDEEQNLTQTGNVMGSPYFMSPEQCQGMTLDNRTDIYSLGCVMYYAVSGVLPFAGKDIMHTLYKHVHEDAMPFVVVRPDLHITAEVEKIILKALARDLTCRYASTEQLLADLTALDDKSTSNTLKRPDAVTQAKAPNAVQSSVGTQSLAYVDTLPEPKPALTCKDLLLQANVITQADLDAAEETTGKLGAEVVASMVANGMLEYYIFDAANRCRQLIQDQQLSAEQAIMLLRYCARSKAEFTKAAKELLGWDIPN